jgi:hypothetical protein
MICQDTLDVFSDDGHGDWRLQSDSRLQTPGPHRENLTPDPSAAPFPRHRAHAARAPARLPPASHRRRCLALAARYLE